MLTRSNEFITIESLHRRGFKPVSLKGKRAIMQQLFDGRDLHFGKNLVVFNAQKQFVAKLVKCEKNNEKLDLEIVASLEDLEKKGYEPLNDVCESDLLVEFLEGNLLFLSENGYIYNEKMNSVACVLPLVWGDDH